MKRHFVVAMVTILLRVCPTEGEVLKCDPRSIRSMRSIRSTDCSVVSQGGRPVQDNFQDHQSQLDVGGVCDLFSFTIYFTICSRTERSHFLPRLHRPIFRLLKMSN